jgi:aspartate oxidase
LKAISTTRWWRGGGLNNRETVEFVIEHAPQAIDRLAKLGVPFNLGGPTNEFGENWHLTREGGHSQAPDRACQRRHRLGGAAGAGSRRAR